MPTKIAVGVARPSAHGQETTYKVGAKTTHKKIDSQVNYKDQNSFLSCLKIFFFQEQFHHDPIFLFLFYSHCCDQFQIDNITTTILQRYALVLTNVKSPNRRQFAILKTHQKKSTCKVLSSTS